LFNWNTKQVFIYVTAKWPSTIPGTPFNEAVVWDQIIPYNPLANPNLPSERRRSKVNPPSIAERGILKLRDVKQKYQITDVSGKLAGHANATLEFHWNVQPWVGALVWTTKSNFGGWKALAGGRSKVFNFPALKEKKPTSAGTP